MDGSERPEPGQEGGAIWWHSRTRYLFARQLVAGADVLDVGCGNGFGTALLAEVARQVVGADVSAEALAHARRAQPGRRFVHIERPPALPLLDASVDAIVCLETIEHLPREAQAPFVRELERVLRPDGLLVLSTPDRDTERATERGTGGENPFHLHTPSASELDALLAGFPERRAFVEQDLVATTVVPADGAERAAALAAAEVVWAATDRPAPVAVLRVCARGAARVPALRAPVALRADWQRQAFVAHVLSSHRLPDLSALPVDEQLGLAYGHARRLAEKVDDVVARLERIEGDLAAVRQGLSLDGLWRRVRGLVGRGADGAGPRP